MRAASQVLGSLDKTRDIYINAVVLSRLKKVFSGEVRGFLPLHPMPRRNAARPGALLPRRGFFLPAGAPAHTGRSPEQEIVVRQNRCALIAHAVL